MRSSCDAIATKFSFSWSSCTVCSWSVARSVAIATRGGDELEELDVVVREPAVDERSDVQDADSSARDEERDTEHRRNALLAQDRVQHVGGRQIVEDHRPFLGGDAAGEAAADGYADTRLDLLLDADRRPRHELVGRRVEQQDGARVGSEDVADPRQEDRQQVVDLEVRQRGVRDGLDVLDPGARPSLGLEQPRVLDRDGGTIRRELEQLDVGADEAPRRQRADVEDADDVACDEQRDAEHRLDPLLAQDRVEHVGVVDVVEDDRPFLGGDAAGEAAADGDPDAGLDLLLDPDGSAGDEFVRLLVEQQHRARVAAEDLPDPRQEHRRAARRPPGARARRR